METSGYSNAEMEEEISKLVFLRIMKLKDVTQLTPKQYTPMLVEYNQIK
jgi:hypothetical protein